MHRCCCCCIIGVVACGGNVSATVGIAIGGGNSNTVVVLLDTCSNINIAVVVRGAVVFGGGSRGIGTGTEGLISARLLSSN